MVTVLVGGLVEEPHTDYSLVETEETDCVLSLPALPSHLMLEPVVGRVNDTLLLCSTDYHLYTTISQVNTQCWTLRLARRPRVWLPVASPVQSLFLPTFTSHESQIYMFGGSEVRDMLSTVRHLRTVS